MSTHGSDHHHGHTHADGTDCHCDVPDTAGAHTANGLGAYLLFGLNLVLGFVAMYLLMFTMIDGGADFYHNLNMGFMALTMLAPMAAIMLATMPGMFPKRWVNLAIYGASAIVFVAALAAIRTQAPIDDQQFIASMIPHHSGAILMCREANIQDPELLTLCDNIQRGQREEIDQMKSILARLGSR